jgi:beta-cyano-L-alanine hydratase/nitrilase
VLLKAEHHPSEQSFGAVVGARTASSEGLDGFKTYYNQAIEVPSTATDKVAAIAKKHDVFLVVGVIERVVGTLYCCAIFVHPKKGLIGKHRKLVPTAAERLVWGYGDASTLPVLEETFKTANQEEVSAKIAATICWENYMPLCK